MTEVARFQAVSDDGEQITVVKYKHPPPQNIDGSVIDLSNYTFALPDGTRLTAALTEDIFWIKFGEKAFKRVPHDDPLPD